MLARSYLFFIKLFLALIISTNAFGQSDTVSVQTERELVIGVHPQPPYIIKGQNGTWSGISVLLWRMVADDLNLTYRLVEVASDALRRGHSRFSCVVYVAKIYFGICLCRYISQ